MLNISPRLESGRSLFRKARKTLAAGALFALSRSRGFHSLPLAAGNEACIVGSLRGLIGPPA